MRALPPVRFVLAASALLLVGAAGCTRSISVDKPSATSEGAPPSPATGAAAPGEHGDEAEGPGGGAVGHTVGQFDYYLLSLSWSPQHCATRGQRARPDDSQCGVSASYGFIVHGLWPQYSARGYPESCAVSQGVPPALVERVMQVMPSQRLIQHEWEKHGTCSGLSAEQYFGRAMELFSALHFPARFASATEPFTMTSDALRQEVLAQNPALPRDGSSVAVACHRGYLSELRLCYSKDFRPQPCTASVRDTCPPSFTVRPLRSAAPAQL